MHIVLYQPEIPPNTGNIIRLAANIGAELHLIHPLGFSLDDKRLRRAGLDYHELAVIREWEAYEAWQAKHLDNRVLAATKRGTLRYDRVYYQASDALLFGSETKGLPDERIAAAGAAIHLPMRTGNRSLNLANSVAVIAYEAWRQQGFV